MRKPSFKTVAIAAATTLFLIATVMAAAIAAIRIHDHREDEKSRLRTFHPNLTPNVINCDRILQNQLVFEPSFKDEPSLKDAESLNRDIQLIQEQRQACVSNRWHPVIIDADRHGMCGRHPLASHDKVGNREIPPGLRLDPARPRSPLSPQSQKDASNNILVHFDDSSRLTVKANCWMYSDKYRTWSSE